MRTILIFILCLTAITTIAAKPFETKRWQTSHGAQVVFYQAMEVPMLDINIAFAAGSAYDGSDFGLSALTMQLLNQGNAGLNASAIGEKLANTGAQYQGQTNRDMTLLSLRTLTEPTALKEATDTFALIIGHPNFTPEAFKHEKNQQLMTIAQALESPEEIANQTFFKALYQNHPYAHPINGTSESVSKLTNEKIRDFYKKFFVAKNAIIVMVGAIDQATAQQLSEKLTHDLAEGQPAPPIPAATPLNEEKNIKVKFPSSQTVLRLGQLGLTHHSKNYFPLMIGNYILGGGSLVSKLALEVREKRGLSYSVLSQFLPMPGGGPFVISLSTANQQATTAIEVTRETLSSFIKTGPTEQELSAAKQFITGSFPLALSSNHEIAAMLIKLAFYHLPHDYIDTYVDRMNAISTTQIKESFAGLIHPDKLIEVTVGKV